MIVHLFCCVVCGYVWMSCKCNIKSKSRDAIKLRQVGIHVCHVQDHRKSRYIIHNSCGFIHFQNPPFDVSMEMKLYNQELCFNILHDSVSNQSFANSD